MNEELRGRSRNTAFAVAGLDSYLEADYAIRSTKLPESVKYFLSILAKA